MEENTIITLEDNISYLIVDKINYHHIDYYYLCSTKKPVEIKIAVEKAGIIYFVENKELLLEVYDTFVYHMREKLGIKEEGLNEM